MPWPLILHFTYSWTCCGQFRSGFRCKSIPDGDFSLLLRDSHNSGYGWIMKIFAQLSTELKLWNKRKASENLCPIRSSEMPRKSINCGLWVSHMCVSELSDKLCVMHNPWSRQTFSSPSRRKEDPMIYFYICVSAKITLACYTFSFDARSCDLFGVICLFAMYA